MKKYIILLMLCLALVAQAKTTPDQVWIDRYELDSSRFVGTRYKEVTAGNEHYHFSLAAKKHQGEINWLIRVTAEAKIPENAHLLIKTFQGEVIDLTIDAYKIEDHGFSVNGYSAGSVIGNICYTAGEYSIQNNKRYFADFAITPEQIALIKEQGIKKFRISTIANYNEQIMNKDEFKKIFIMWEADIKKHLEHNLPIFENF